METFSKKSLTVPKKMKGALQPRPVLQIHGKVSGKNQTDNSHRVSLKDHRDLTDKIWYRLY